MEKSLTKSQNPLVIEFVGLPGSGKTTLSNKDSYFDLMDSKQVYYLLTKYFPSLQEIVNCAQTANIPILEVDGSLTVEENSEKIVNWIVSQISDSYE